MPLLDNRLPDLNNKAGYGPDVITHIQTQSILIIEDNRAPFHCTVYSFTTPEQPCLTVVAWPEDACFESCCKQTVPNASRNYTAGATCDRISSLGTVQAFTAVRTMISLDVRLNYAAIQNLVYGCGNVPQTIAKSSDTPPIHCAQHLQQSVDMSIQLPAELQCYPVQMAEVVQEEYVLVGGPWLYPRVTVANTVHLSKHHSYCMQSKIEDAKTGLLSHIWSPMNRDKWITNTTTPQYAHIIPCDSLKFQTSITVVQSFIRPYVNFCAI